MSNDIRENISISKRIRFGLSPFGTVYGYMLYSAVITYYFTDILGIASMTVGTLLLVSRVWDAINDPIMGIIVDRTNTRIGKARPWILAGGIWCSIAIFLLFFNPNLKTETAKVIWAYVVYNGFGMAYTMLTVPYNVMIKRTTHTPQGIVSLNSTSFFFAGLGAILFSSNMLRIVDAFSFDGDVSKGYMWSGAVAGVLILVTSVILFTVKEENDCELESRRVPIRDSLKAVISSKSFIVLTVTALVMLIGYYMSAGTIMYYCIYNLKNLEYFTLLNTIDYGTPLLAALIVPFAIRKLDKRSIVVISLFAAAAAYGLRYITGDANVGLMTAFAILSGTGIACFNTLFVPLAFDCALESQAKTGINNDGLFQSSFTFIMKSSSGIGGAAVAFGLDKINYVSNAEIQKDSVLEGLKILSLGGTAVFMLVAGFVFLAFYKLKNSKN